MFSPPVPQALSAPHSSHAHKAEIPITLPPLHPAPPLRPARRLHHGTLPLAAIAIAPADDPDDAACELVAIAAAGGCRRAWCFGDLVRARRVWAAVEEAGGGAFLLGCAGRRRRGEARRGGGGQLREALVDEDAVVACGGEVGVIEGDLVFGVVGVGEERD